MLNDDGVNGDKKAGDGIWSCNVLLPQGVPAGIFHFDFQTLDSNLNAIYQAGTVENGMGEQVSLEFTVK